jgi:RNA 2',3'-cyclic 3'-phosphodiesterase
LRLFLAGPLPEALQADVFAALTAARRAASQARWVRPGQLHLTLAFLGETDGAQVPSLVEALRLVGPRHQGPMLGLRGAGCFGRPEKPDVLFAELTGDVGLLRALEADVRGALGPWRPPDATGRAFHPHLTLARARSRQGDASLGRCQRALRAQVLGAFLLERLVLFRSELVPTGSRHTPVAEFPLGGSAAAHP